MSSLNANAGPRYRHNADDSAPYETITVEKLTPIIGAEIEGVDLSSPLSNQQFQEIHDALAENLVIFFRDQDITPQQHAFGRLFGELHVHPTAPSRGPSGKHDASRPTPTRTRCGRRLAFGRVLRCRTADGIDPPHQQWPPSGGDTMFASMYAAYDSLSDR